MSKKNHQQASPEELEREARQWDSGAMTTRGWRDASEAIPRVGNSTLISLRLPTQMLEILRAFAEREGVGYQVLMKRWLDDRIRQEREQLQGKNADSGWSMSEVPLDTLADFYIDVANQESERLKACLPPVSIGSDGYSDHFRHAVICSLFSALAVEHAITELIWVRCVFPKIFGPYPGKKSARKTNKRPAMLDFLKSNTSIPRSLIGQIDQLFTYRNKIAHAHPKPFQGKTIGFEAVQELNERGRGEELDEAINDLMEQDDDSKLRALANEVGKEQTSLTFDSLSTEDLDLAFEHLKIAKDALSALREEWHQKG